MRVFYLCAFMLCMSVDGYAAVNCGVQFNNQSSGDTLSGSVHWDGLVDDHDNGVRWAVSTSSGAVINWDRATVSPSQPNASFTMTAGVANEAVWFTQTAGTDSMSCYFFSTQVTPVRLGNATVFSGPDKEKWGRYKDGFSGLAFIAGGASMATTSAGFPQVALAWRILGWGSAGMALYAAAKVNDPWDWNYQSPYYAPLPNPEDFGGEWVSSGDQYLDLWLNWLVELNREILQAGDGAAVSMDRASSCQLAGDGCVYDRISELTNYIATEQYNYRQYSYALWVIAYYGAQLGMGGDQVAQLQSQAQFFGDAGNNR